MDELVNSVDAMSREQAARVVKELGLETWQVPVFLPFAKRSAVPLAPEVSAADEKLVYNVSRMLEFLLDGKGGIDAMLRDPRSLAELRPYMPIII